MFLAAIVWIWLSLGGRHDGTTVVFNFLPLRTILIYYPLNGDKAEADIPSQGSHSASVILKPLFTPATLSISPGRRSSVVTLSSRRHGLYTACLSCYKIVSPKQLNGWIICYLILKLIIYDYFLKICSNTYSYRLYLKAPLSLVLSCFRHLFLIISHPGVKLLSHWCLIGLFLITYETKSFFACSSTVLVLVWFFLLSMSPLASFFVKTFFFTDLKIVILCVWIFAWMCACLVPTEATRVRQISWAGVPDGCWPLGGCWKLRCHLPEE